MQGRGRFPIMIGVIQEDTGVLRAFCEIKLIKREEPLVMISLRTFTTPEQTEEYIMNEISPTFPSQMDTLSASFDGEWMNGFSDKNAILVANMFSGVFGFALDPDDKDFGIKMGNFFQEVLHGPDGTIFVFDSAHNEHLNKFAPLVQMLSSSFETILVCEEKASDTHEELIGYLNQLHSEFKQFFAKHEKPTGAYALELQKFFADRSFVSVGLKIRRSENQNVSKSIH